MQCMTARVLKMTVGVLVAATTGCDKDTEVRTYIEQELRPYLDSLTQEACTARERDNLPQNWLCDTADPDTYQKPPQNGKP